MAVRERISILASKDAKLKDNVSLWFGNGTSEDDGDLGDVEIRWDGTDLDILPAANNSILKIGADAKAFDLWLYGNSSNAYISWDASADDFKFEDSVSLKFEDSINLEFGTGAGAGPGNAGDASITFDGTRLVVSPIAAGGIVHIGDAAGTAPHQGHIFYGAAPGGGGRA